MGKKFIDDELQDVSRLCHNDVQGSKIVSCVQAMVRVEITYTPYKKIIVCIQFPKDYPNEALLIELKSKTLSTSLLLKLTDLLEKECRNKLGTAQILSTLKFVSNFIEENPLISVYDEISALKSLLTEQDELKLRQKNSTVSLKLQQGLYYFRIKIAVPDNYPEIAVNLTDEDTNFPPLFNRFLLGQGRELARRCVQPPLKKKPNQPPFQPSPSLKIVASFLITTFKKLPIEHCQLCKILCLPANPKEVVTTDENADLHIERLYCGHLFHMQCLITFMKTPPFHGGKKCPTCGQRVFHDKWGISDKLAEDRWAHHEARARELSEVADFFQ